MKPLDKKQVPQVIALAVLAVAFFIYFAAKMILPTPAAAGTQAAPVAAKPQAKAVPVATATVDGTFTAPAPKAGMHDPFVQGVSDQAVPAPTTAPPAMKPAPAVRTASLRVTGIAPLAIPAVPSLPGGGIQEEKLSPLGGRTPVVPSLPVAPVAPDWTVTGVLQSGTNRVAILRCGDARRFVKQGDHVDSQFVVALVTRDYVVLRHGHSRFTLPLGGAKVFPTGPAKITALSGVMPDVPRSAAPPVALPDAVPDAVEGRPVVHTAPHPKSMKQPFPSIARLLVSPLTPNGLPGLTHRASFVSLGAGHPSMACLPLAVRRSIPATVRVADYQSEQTSPLSPVAGTHGLLPSGLEAPDFSLSTLGGETFSLSQFRGNVVVLDFWASWYAPATRSLATLALLQKKLGAQGLTVLAVNSWDNKLGMQAALEGGEGSTMQLYDPGVSNDSVAVCLYHAPDVPAFYVIDREGRVAGAFVGSGQSTIRNIEATLAKLGILS